MVETPVGNTPQVTFMFCALRTSTLKHITSIPSTTIIIHNWISSGLLSFDCCVLFNSHPILLFASLFVSRVFYLPKHGIAQVSCPANETSKHKTCRDQKPKNPPLNPLLVMDRRKISRILINWPSKVRFGLILRRISNLANVSRVVENGCRICEPS